MIISPTAPPPLGIAHFTTITVEPMALVEMAARIGYAAVGLRLYPAFPGAPFYRIPAGSAAMRAMRGLLAATGITVYDIEFLTIDADLDIETLKPVLESAAELGAKRLSACGDDPDPARFAATLARLCDAADAFGLAIDLEMMPWRRISTLLTAWDALQRAARPNAAILIDALHLSIAIGRRADGSAHAAAGCYPVCPALRRHRIAAGDDRFPHPRGARRPLAAERRRLAAPRADR